jgi:hypothetical protein
MYFILDFQDPGMDFFFFFESMRERKKEKNGDVGKGEMGVGESFSTSLSTLPKSVFPTAIEALGP